MGGDLRLGGMVVVKGIKESLRKGKRGPLEEKRAPGGEAEAGERRGRWGISQCIPPLISSPSGFLEPRSASLTCKREAL